jgi:uncharacterized membrane-anchored protein
MMSGLRLFGAALVVAAAQIGFLAAMIEGRAAILRDGKTVLLKVEPVDPRDLLRGDYVRLGYAISTLDRSLFGATVSDDEIASGTPVMVRLAPGEDGLWQAVSARPAATEIEPAPGAVDIRGRVNASFAAIGSVRIDYGIERFYLPEGEGLAIERDLGVRPFRMLVAVGADGTAQIKSFLDGDVPLYDEPLY